MKIWRGFMTPTYDDVDYCLWTLRLAETRLQKSASRLMSGIALSFPSMTREKRDETTGQVLQMSVRLLVLCDEFLKIDQSLNSSRMPFSMLPSSGDVGASEP